jgi:hypothetical protein
MAGSRTRRSVFGGAAALGGLALAAPVLAAAPGAALPPPDRAAEPELQDDLASTVIPTEGDAFEHVIAPVLINGLGPFRFMVDTGANVSCVSQRLARQLALQEGRPLFVHTIVGRRQRRSVVLESLQVGERTRRKVAAPVLPMVGFDIDGVLGIDWLKGQRLVFGFREKTLEITRSQRDDAREGRVVVPARRKSGQLTIIDADLGSERIHAMIDSGSQFSIGNTTLRRLIERQDPTAASRALPVDMVTIAGEGFVGQQLYLPFVRLGGLNLGNVPVVFTEQPVFRLWDLHDKPTMMLGVDLLTEFHMVALDFGRSAVRFDFDEA